MPVYKLHMMLGLVTPETDIPHAQLEQLLWIQNLSPKAES